MRRLGMTVGLMAGLLLHESATAFQQLGGDAQRNARSSQVVPENPAPVWQRRLRGAAFASAVVSHDTVYTVAGRTVSAHNVASGDLRWQVENGGEMSATPALAGRWLVVGAKDGTVRAFDRQSGERGWEFRTGGRVVAALLAANDTIYVGATDSFLYALSAESGELRWRFEAPDYKYGGLYAPATYADNTVYFGVKNGWLYAVEARTGVLRWRAQVGSAVYSAPVIADGRVYVGSYNRHLYALRQQDGALLWRSGFPDWPQGSALVHRGRVHVACRNGEVFALERKDGSIAWRLDLGSELRHGLVLGRNGRALLGTADGELVTLDLDKPRVAGRVPVEGAIHAQPILAAAGLFVTTLAGQVLRLQ